MKKCHYSKMIRILKYCLCAIILCSAIEAYGVWNKVKQFSTAASCGYFFDADNGIIGLGEFAQGGLFGNKFIGNQPLAIYWTNDGGASWTQSIMPPGGIGRVTRISMQDRLVGYAAIYSQSYSAWKTTDGGKSWKDFTKGNNVLSTSIYVTTKAITKTNWFGNPGGSSVDGGTTFTQIFSGGFNGSNGIDFTDDLNGVVTMGPPGNASWITSDGGISWRAGGNLPESWSVYGVKGTKSFLTMSEDDAGNPGQALYLSENGGLHWNSRFTFQRFTTFTGHIAGEGNTLYVQTDNNANQGLFRSDDLGASWINVGGPSNVRDTRFLVTGCRGEVVYAFDNQGGVWKTTDGGNGDFGFTPRVGEIISTKAGDTTLIPIYIDSTKPILPITIFEGSISMNTDLLTPFGFDTAGTLSKNVSFDTLYYLSPNSAYFRIKYAKPLQKISFSKPLINIRAVVYLAKADSTDVSLGSLIINTGADIPPTICSELFGKFTITNECGDSTLRGFMVTGNIAKLLSINPNPSASNSVEMRIYLPEETGLSLDILDENGKYRYSGIAYDRFSKGEQSLKIGIAALGNGIYYLRLHLNSGSYLTGSVVITR